VLVPHGKLVALETWIDSDRFVIFRNFGLRDMPSATFTTFLAVLWKKIVVDVGKVGNVAILEHEDTAKLPGYPKLTVCTESAIDYVGFFVGNQEQQYVITRRFFSDLVPI
jgi:hypothetical protein